MNKTYVLYNGSQWLINLDFIENVYYNVLDDRHKLTITMTSGKDIEFTTSKLNEDHINQKEAIIKLWKELIK